MGTGCKNKCVIVDLDGTLVKGNTLHMLMQWMVLRKLPLNAAGKILVAACKRVLRLSGHVAMKACVLNVARNTISDADLGGFISYVTSRVNADVMAVIDRYRTSVGALAVIATAAPDYYVAPLTAALGLDSNISSCTDTLIEHGCEMRGEAKKQAVCAMAEEKGLEIIAVITDHEDDLPLLTLTGVERILVNPSHRLCELLNAASLHYMVL